MISLKLINLLIACTSFIFLMVVFFYQIKSIRLKLTNLKMFKFYFIIACLGIICREIWILRFDPGYTVKIYYLWGVIIYYLAVIFIPEPEKNKLSESKIYE